MKINVFHDLNKFQQTSQIMIYVWEWQAGHQVGELLLHYVVIQKSYNYRLHLYLVNKNNRKDFENQLKEHSAVVSWIL